MSVESRELKGLKLMLSELESRLNCWLSSRKSLRRREQLIWSSRKLKRKPNARLIKMPRQRQIERRLRQRRSSKRNRRRKLRQRKIRRKLRLPNRLNLQRSSNLRPNQKRRRRLPPSEPQKDDVIW